MDFKAATDAIIQPVRLPVLAKALGVSEATVRQARLRKDARAYRSPPEGWQSAVIRLAEARIAEDRQLIRRLLDTAR